MSKELAEIWMAFPDGYDDQRREFAQAYLASIKAIISIQKLAETPELDHEDFTHEQVVELDENTTAILRICEALKGGK